MREHVDTVIIGGGQAGLAMSTVLQRHGREHVVLERRRIGERWRTERWESLRLQFPNWTVQLPSQSYAGGDPDGFAHYREILGFIEGYAASTRAPVREHTEVVALDDAGDGGFVVSIADGALHTRRVVVATGPFQRPLIPPPWRDVSRTVLQIHPTRYRSPGELPAGAVLVVGSGASGIPLSRRRRDASHLPHQGEGVEHVPVLDEFAVANSDDVDDVDRDHVPGRRQAINSPVWVPWIILRVTTLSPSASMSCTWACRSGTARRNAAK
jgi:glycine/D-amino acid oxidase-like deaminating enzyme